MLGNLTVKDIEERLDITLSEEDRAALGAIRCNSANDIPADGWHCFDIPFMILCGSMKTHSEVCRILSPYSSMMTGNIKVAVQGKEE